MKSIVSSFLLVLVCAWSAHGNIHVPDSVKQTTTAETEFILRQIQNSSEDIPHQVRLKCYLSKLYNREGKYDEAQKLIDEIPPSEYNLLIGEVSLAKAINLKYQLQPKASKLFFDRAILEFTLTKRECLLIETHIELIEYYRKFDLIDLAFKEAEKAESLLKINQSCDPVLTIRYLNRLASVQNINNTTESIQTSYRCIDSCIKYNEKYYLAISYNEIGYSYQHIPNLDSADFYYRKAEELFRSQELILDFLHVKMNRMRMYAHKQINNSEIIPGLLEIETEALEKAPTYDLAECYRSIWVEAQTIQDFETAFEYLRKFYYLDLARIESDVAEQVEKVKQQEKESQTKIQNLVLSSQVQTQKSELKQTKTIVWLVIIAFIILLAISLFLFRILKQRDKLTKDLALRNTQKDELIQEVHHRVKNNLSFVSSLLEMQINSLPEESKTEELKNASLRIESMSLVHQMLYTQDDITTVDLSTYIPELLSYLKDSLIHEDKLEVQLTSEPIKVESRTATAFGLIITEFVTNSIKHAFNGISNPKIEIDLHKNKTDLVLIMRDNGVGMRAGNGSSKSGFGMRIIDIFSRQINATVNFSFEKGTQLTLIMSYEE
ncbi:MAG: sensor histidine kinase [Bacteroidetes bacterium]|nr:sensor histidine kinase [Bacteroidota bacterium]